MSDDPYRDPILYDLEYAAQRDDVVFYTALARRQRGPVAELGCGNGRILVPIARAGVAIHGVDASAAMLEDLARKMRKEAVEVQLRATWQQGDFGSLAGAYGLVIWPFNAMHHVPGHQALLETLGRVRAALREDGVLALDCYLPDPGLYSRNPRLRYEERTDVHPVSSEPLLSWEEGWWEPENRVHHVVYVWQHADGREERLHLALHMYELEELRSLLFRAGFRVQWEAEDFDGRRVSPASLKWIAELRPR
jgi:SAM-dependent methyltransferase